MNIFKKTLFPLRLCIGCKHAVMNRYRWRIGDPDEFDQLDCARPRPGEIDYTGVEQEEETFSECKYERIHPCGHRGKFWEVKT